MDKSKEFLQYQIDNPHNVAFKSLISHEDREDTVNGFKKMLEVVSSDAFEDYQAFQQVIEDSKSSAGSCANSADEDVISHEFVELVLDILEALYNNAEITAEKMLIEDITRHLSASIEPDKGKDE